MKILRSLLIVLVVMAGSPVVAQEENHRAFLAASYMSPLGDREKALPIGRESVEVDSSVGWNVGGEWRFTGLIGLEVDLLVSTHDFQAGGEVFGESDFTSLSASLNFHLLDSRRVDLYVAPTLSVIDWDDLQLNDFGRTITSETAVGGSSAWGLSAGADIVVAERFAVLAGLRWVNMEITPGDMGEIGVFPITSRLGFSYRW